MKRKVNTKKCTVPHGGGLARHSNNEVDIKIAEKENSQNKIEMAKESAKFEDFKAFRIDAIYEVEENEKGLKSALDNVRELASEAVVNGANILIISDRLISKTMAPIPSLLAVGAVHHHLINEKTRSSTGIIVESGDAREVHHIAALLGYGASAVCPYTVYETIDSLIA